MSADQGVVVSRLSAFKRAATEFLFGMTGHEFAQQANHLRHEAETLHLLVTFGDMVGLPILPPYYSLHLLVYVVPRIEGWKRQLLRENHALDKEEFDLIEL